MTSQSSNCAVCSALSILVCNRCLESSYCSDSCWEEDWEAHKHSCFVEKEKDLLPEIKELISSEVEVAVSRARKAAVKGQARKEAVEYTMEKKNRLQIVWGILSHYCDDKNKNTDFVIPKSIYGVSSNLMQPSARAEKALLIRDPIKVSEYQGKFKLIKKNVCLSLAMRDGYGVEHFITGQVYLGGYKRGIFHGWGKLLLDNSCGSIEGRFVGGYLNGFGRETFPSGVQYCGEFADGVPVAGSFGYVLSPEGELMHRHVWGSSTDSVYTGLEQHLFDDCYQHKDYENRMIFLEKLIVATVIAEEEEEPDSVV